MHDYIKTDLNYTGYEGVAWIRMHQVVTSDRILPTQQ